MSFFIYMGLDIPNGGVDVYTMYIYNGIPDMQSYYTLHTRYSSINLANANATHPCNELLNYWLLLLGQGIEHTLTHANTFCNYSNQILVKLTTFFLE